MKTFIGVKVVEAEPQQREKWMSKKFEDRDDHSLVDGYKVVYEDGYTSWSPKDVFEASYREISALLPITKSSYHPHENRVVVEALDLNRKTVSLFDFIHNNKIYPSLVSEEQNRLKKQLEAMQYYLAILVERINNF